MRTERSSPGTVEAPKEERGLRLLKEERAEKEGRAVRATLLRKAKEVTKDFDLPFSIEEEKGELTIETETNERILSAKDYEGFDFEELKGNPNFRTETRRIGSLEYTVTERIKDAKGHESSVVRPDGHGQYPEQEDLRAAMAHDFFLAQRWMHKDRIFPDEAALVMHSYHRKPSEWLYQAMESLMAAKPELGAEHAARMAATVINDLMKAHTKRMESL